MRQLLIMVFSFLVAASGYAKASPQDMQTALDAARIKNNVSAMQMTVIMPDKKVMTLVSGTTMKKKGAPAITPNTLFQIGSDTKSFTSALIFKLEIEGLLKLTDPLSKYFPQYTKWSNVTISQLLHNNSGIPSYTHDKTFQVKLFNEPDYVWKNEELVAYAANKPIKFKPGEGWEYSNTNFILAGMIIEKVTNKSIANLFQNYFFSKASLDLSNTYYTFDRYPPAIIERMAHGINEKNRDVTDDNMSWGRTAGAIVSNSNDLAKWAYDLFHNIVLPKPAMEQMMMAVSTKTGKPEKGLTEGYACAIGTRVNKQFGKWWGHEGETLAYHAIFVWYPEYDITIAITTNGDAKHLLEFATSVPGLLGVKPAKSS